ncbi:hypothetical protein MBLNU459_g7286t1 [Dothideomycetes sp. NU459]
MAAADGISFKYTERDVILYNIGLGADRASLSLVYENSPLFEVLPSFGVIAYNDGSLAKRLAPLLPNFSYYLEIRKFPLPVSGTLLSYPVGIELVDKGKAAVVVTAFRTVDASTGEDVFYNEQTVYVRGSGGFGGASKGKDRGPATAANRPPARAADATTTEKTSEDQAIIYRLSGDYNPLHIDPETARAGGFDSPILHGLCVFGIAAKHVYTRYGPFRNIKVRFAGTTIPGQTLKTEMWRVDEKVIFETTVVETGKLAIAAAAVELWSESPQL